MRNSAAKSAKYDRVIASELELLCEKIRITHQFVRDALFRSSLDEDDTDDFDDDFVREILREFSPVQIAKRMISEDVRTAKLLKRIRRRVEDVE